MNLCRDPADWGTLCVRLVPTWETLFTGIPLCFALDAYRTPLGYVLGVRQRSGLVIQEPSADFSTDKSFKCYKR